MNTRTKHSQFLSVAMLAIGGVEFICAQSSYSMRGLMFGVSFGAMAVFVLFGYGITQLFADLK